MADRTEANRHCLDLVTSIATQARQDTYAAHRQHGQQKYRRMDKPITPETLSAHLANAQPIACYFIKGDQTTVAVLDFDDHDKSLDWGDLVAAARPVVDALESLGMRPLCCRSGGGAGLHIWLFWDEPQSARLVKQFLRGFIEDLGFKHGAAGVQRKEIEVFPKQDRVKAGAYGNAVALPYSRRSVPLDQDLQPLDWADFMPPALEDLVSHNVVEIYIPPKSVAKASSSPIRTLAEQTSGDSLPGDGEEARDALKLIEADDYEVWTKIGLALKSSLGDLAFEIWDEWSGKSAKYPGSEACRKLWEDLSPSGDLSIGTIFHMAQQNGWSGPKNPIVREMNARFGILTHGSSTRIIVKQPDKGQVLTWLGKQAFLDRLKPEKFPQENAQGDVTWRPKAPYWLNHHLADHYHQVIFDPDRPAGHNGHSWNMWQGFEVEPKPGDWRRLQHHILVNICSGNDELADWMLNWMALGVQRPGEVIGTAPVLRGLPGTGKGVLANAYGRLWGPHYVSITKDEHVIGHFNQHLLGRRFVYADEAMFGGDRRNAGVIKTMLTEPRIMIEAKGVDPIWLDNHMIFMVTSNERSVVPADIGERRWQVVKVADTCRNDRVYFGGVVAQLESGGFEAMLFDLLHRDISEGPDPHKTIRTPELFDQIIQAQGPVERYLYQVLDAAHLPQPDAPGNGPGVSTIAAMYAEMRHTQPNAQYVQRTLFGRTIGKMFPGVSKVQSGQFITGRDAMGRMLTERSTRYHFPPLIECRRAFEAHIGQKVPWSNDVEEWQGATDPGHDYDALRRDEDVDMPF